MPELKKILHVDDDEDILALARMSLEIVGGLEVHQCSLAADALEELPQVQPDLLLLDVMMPGTDGPQLLAEIRKMPDYEKTPAVFMTAKAEAALNNSLKKEGVLGVLTKPFDPMQLPDELRRMWADATEGETHEA
eukprot:TRINITY_DN80428_c0_g1_i1.p2 TRINITY_DN80428_c0_g1~~TRINITY_DN80428_c0_g1_i1.p2  ORF type:complete len:135 (-),score=10.77 TRINITY_DN80428_c0_g1_i1:825-1229(-)